MALQTKNAFVTGAAKGIGKGIVESLLKAGARVVFGDKDTEAGRATEKELSEKYGGDKVFFEELDVTNNEQFQEVFQKAVQKLEYVNLMVNNAGIMNESVWELMMDINFNGVVRGTYIAMEHMRKDKGGKGGRIIATNSEQGLDLFLISPVYCASKQSSRAFVQCLALSPNLEEMGIEFALLCPGAVLTDLTSKLNADMIHHAGVVNVKPKFVNVDVVAEAFMELVTYENMNGAMLRVDVNEKQHYKVQKIKISWPPTEEDKKSDHPWDTFTD